MTALHDPTPPAGDGIAGVQFRTVGSAITLALVDLEEYKQKDFATGELRTFANGDPMTGTLIFGLVVKVDGDGVYTGAESAPAPVEIGELVALFIEGSRYFAWKAAKAEFKDGFETGDLIWFALTDTEPSGKGRPRKIYSAKIGKNDGAGEFGEWKSKADAAHHGRKSTSIADPTPTPAPATDVSVPF